MKSTKKNRLKQPENVEWSPTSIKKIIAACFGVGLVVIAYQYINIYVLPIQSLYVTGEISHMDQRELKRTVKSEIDAGFFSVDVDRVKNAVQGLPWVQSVSVRRVWPDSLHLEITEHIAVARWGREYLINQRGHLFKISNLNARIMTPDNELSFSSLPHITGPKDMFSGLFAQYQQMQMIIESTGLSVDKVAVNARRSMRVTLNNGIVLLLGRVVEETYDYQELARFVIAYKQTLLHREAEISEIDLRYTNGFAVQWKDKKLVFNTDTTSFRNVRGFV